LLADTQANRCVVTVAAPQLPTIDAAGATLCTSPNACPAMWIDLDSQVMR
jgi:hypothetical protein